MESVGTFVIDNWGAVASIFVSSLIGYATSYYFFHRQKQKRQISYTAVYNQLYSDLIRENTFYDFRWGPFVIENPYLIRVIIWNDGNETITRADLSRSDPLQLNVAESFVIAARWKEISSLATVPTLDIDEKKGRISLDFEFLEPQSGFAMDVVCDHKGDDHKTHPVVFLSGSVKGSRVLSRYRPSGFSSKRFYLVSVFTLLVSVLALSSLIPLTSLFIVVDPNLVAVAATLVAIGGIVVASTTFGLSIALWPRTYFPDMVGTKREDIGTFPELSASDKWRVASTSLQMYAHNERAGRRPPNPRMEPPQSRLV